MWYGYHQCQPVKLIPCGVTLATFIIHSFLVSNPLSPDRYISTRLRERIKNPSYGICPIRGFPPPIG